MPSSKVTSRQPLNTRQRLILIEFYEKNPYPSAIERQQLVQMTGRTSKQIQDWFSNRRRNDPKLVADKPVNSLLPVSAPSMTMDSVYYYTPTVSPSIANICPCCYFQSSSVNDQSIYSPCTTFYYSSSNNTFHS